MRSTFLGYQTAQSALNYAQKAIDIVGNNIANGSSDGYTRQQVDAVSTSTAAGSNRLASSRTALAGQGVTTVGVSQSRNTYLEAQYRSKTSIASTYSTAEDLLNDIQTALVTGADVTSESGSTDTSNAGDVLGAIENIYNCINDYISDPTSDSQAGVVYSAFQNFATVMNTASKALTDARNAAISTTQDGVNTVNDILSQIANINDQMAKGAANYNTPDSNTSYYDNELMDKRNTLLDKLASYTDFSVTEHSDGTCDVSIGDKSVVSGDQYSTMIQTTASDNTISIKWLDSGEDVGFSSGSLLSDLNYINGRGKNVQSNTESSAQGFLYYQDRLNTLASTVVSAVNNTIPQLDSSGTVTGYKKLLGAMQSDGSVSTTATVTADNLSVSDEWSDGGVGYFIYSKSSADYSYALQIANAMVNKDYTFNSYGETFTGTMEEYVTDYVTALASDISVQSGLSDTASQVASDYQDSRDQVEAVSQDEETSDLLTYQKLYEAAARVMTTMDDLLDVVINKMAV